MSELIKERFLMKWSTTRNMRNPNQKIASPVQSSPISHCMSGCYATCYHSLVFSKIWMNQESKWVLEISVVCWARLHRIKSLCKPLYWMRSNLTVIVNKWLPARVRKLEMLIWSSSCLPHYESLQSGLSIDMQNMQLVAEREPKLSNT